MDLNSRRADIKAGELEAQMEFMHDRVFEVPKGVSRLASEAATTTAQGRHDANVASLLAAGLVAAAVANVASSVAFKLTNAFVAPSPGNLQQQVPWQQWQAPPWFAAGCADTICHHTSGIPARCSSRSFPSIEGCNCPCIRAAPPVRCLRPSVGREGRQRNAVRWQ